MVAMNQSLVRRKRQSRGPETDEGTRNPIFRAFMNDIIVMTLLTKEE